MNDNKNELEEWATLDCDAVDFDELENKLDSDLEEQMADLKGLEEDRDKIGSPDSLGKTVMNVVWEQFINQVGVIAGEDFIRENRGLTLDLRNSAHIQTVENFKEGKIAEHNYISQQQLKENHNRYINTPHSEFRKKYVDSTMDNTLERAGTLHSNGIETVKDIYTGRQISTKTKLEDGRNNPEAAQREHVKPSAEIYKDPSLQMAYDNEQLAAIINDPNNLQGYTTAERNNRKSDNSANEMEDKDKNKHWEKANKRSEDYIQGKKEEGKNLLIKEGKATQKEEAFRIGGKALRSVVMGLLADLIKEVIQKLVAWFRNGSKKLNSFIDSLKAAIKAFISNLKEHLLNAGNVLVTTIATAIFGPIVGVIKKAWILLKQGYNSVKQAIKFLKDPANKAMPFSIKMMQVGKIVIAGLTAGGAIVLSEVIEKALMTVPPFSIEIPLLGSLASLIGMFLGALVSGLIGALALNVIDRLIAKRLKKENDIQRLDKKNEIIGTQERLIVVTGANVANTKARVATNIAHRHYEAGNHFNDIKQRISQIEEELGSLHDSTNKTSNHFNDIKQRISQIEEELGSLHDSTNKTNDDIANLLKNL